METTLALVANTALAWTALRFARQRTGRTLAWCVAAAWVAFLTRPDSGLHGLCLPPLLLLAHDRHRRDLALRYVAAFALVLLVDAAWKLAWFGNALPLPFFAKSSGFHDGYIGVAKWNAAHETLAFVRACLPFFVVMALAPSRDALSKLAAIGLPLVGTLAYFATVTQVMGWEARYYYPSIPFVVLGALIAADARFARAPEEPLFASRSAVFGVLGVAAVLGVLVSGPVDRALSETWQHHVITTPAAERPTRDYAMRTAEPVQELGWWGAVVAFDALLGRLPDDVVVAASEVGFIGAQHADMTLIDLSGLNDRQIAREGFAVSYVMAREPDLIWLPHGDYTGAVARLLDDDGFRERYLFFPFLYDFGVAVRRDGELTEGILGQLGAEVTRLYGGAQLPDLQAHPVD